MSYLKRFGKVRIGAANTEQAVINFLPAHMTGWQKVDRIASYIDELRQQAKWDAEKCGNQ
jgi:hypothetical protein